MLQNLLCIRHCLKNGQWPQGRKCQLIRSVDGFKLFATSQLILPGTDTMVPLVDHVDKMQSSDGSLAESDTNRHVQLYMYNTFIGHISSSLILESVGSRNSFVYFPNLVSFWEYVRIERKHAQF